MGWSSGTDLFVMVVDSYENLHGDIDENVKEEFYRELIDSFTFSDWDCVYEVEGINDTLDRVLLEDNWVDEDE